MNTQNVKQIIKGLFNDNFNSYPDSYPLNEDGTATNEASETVADVAKSYWETRTEEEEARDEKLGITQIDYVEWCMEAFAERLNSDDTF